MQQRETAAHRLADVLQVIRLGRRTGILSVERGSGRTFEEGYITFVDGQITQAHTGRLSGADAFNTLITWEACRFVFLSQSPPTLSAPSLPPSIRPPTLPTPQTHNHSNGSTDPLRPIAPTPGSQNARRKTQRLDIAPLELSIPSTARTANVPQRVQQLETALSLIESFGLSRAHRRLFLLIDGKRGTMELVRLVGHTLDEIQVQLDDLERVGLIRQ